MALKTITVAEFDSRLNFSVDTATNEITEVVFKAKDSFSDSQYFFIYSTTTTYYVWFDVSGSAGDPAPGGTGIEVDISADTTSYEVAASVAAAIDTNGAFNASVIGGDRIQIEADVAGSVIPATDGDSGVFIHHIVEGHGNEARYIFPQSSTGLDLNEDHYDYVRNTLGGGDKFKALDAELLEDAVSTNPDVQSFMLIADEDSYETAVLSLTDAQKIT